MKTHVLQVKTCDDWNLVCAVNLYDNDLKPLTATVLMNASWRLQDGYGIPGFNPPQGWDWSGIRDSSEQAKRAIAEALRRILAVQRIETITVTCQDNVEFK